MLSRAEPAPMGEQGADAPAMVEVVLARCADVAAAEAVTRAWGEPSSTWVPVPLEPRGSVPAADAGTVLHWYDGGAPSAEATTPADVAWWRGCVRGSASLPRAGRGDGLLTVFMEPVPGAENEFNAWYDTEHFPSLTATPGVVWAARFAAVGPSSPGYLAAYELARPDVRHSEAWRRATAPTPWTTRMRGLTTGRGLHLWQRGVTA